jgi:survival-of-motor-neuron-related-splicing factor 30
VVGSEPEKPLQQTAAKKKSKKVKEFEVPAHLLIHEADTEAEKNRKRRAIKALKNKWRERKKEVETEMKQQSWQSFQQKTLKKRKDENTSIFATQEGDHAAKVGVVSASRGMTEFGERKRHKHT